MAPSNAQLVAQLRQLIWYHLDNDLIDNAVFLASRLHALDSRAPDFVHLLAVCHLRAGQLKIAYDYCRNVVQKRDHSGCAYVFAQAALGLERYSEGLAILERCRPAWEGRAPLGKTDCSRRPVPDAAAFHCILGKLAQSNGDRQKAVDAYVAALKLNPFMWDAYERLCDLGASIRPSNVFKESQLPASFIIAFDTASLPRLSVSNSIASLDAPVSNAQSNPQIEVTQAPDPFNIPKHQPRPDHNMHAPEVTSKSLADNLLIGPASQSSLMETPPTLATDDDAISRIGPRANHAPSVEPPMAPLRRSRIQPSVSESHGGADVAKLRSAAGKINSKEGSVDPTESHDTKKNMLFPPRNSKRTISGNDAVTKAPGPPLDPVNIGQRRSVRLTKKAPVATNVEGEPDHKKVKATGTRGRLAATSTVGRVVSGNRKPPEYQPSDNAKDSRPQAATNIATISTQPKPATSEILMPQRSRVDIPDKDSDATSVLPHLLNLVRPLAQAYYALAQYDPKQALSILSTLSNTQRETPYVLILTGRAYHDLNKYDKAAEIFAKVRQSVPSQVQHLEVFSIALWHQKKDTELAFLSHELVESARLAPQSWCCLGNSFSLQRDHDNAIKCFRRATQLEPKVAYPWRLLGHEYFATEDLEKASHSYRKAVAADNRHYQGWYGLGRVYERHGRLDQAEQHYRLALGINPRSDVLACCIGTVQDKQGHHSAALSTYEQAVKLNPGNAIARFKLSRSMLRLRRYEDALHEFLALKDQAPEEANVHFMLGRVYRMLGQKADAVRSLSNALGLDPKAAPLIKDAMEALGEEDDEMAEAEDEDEDMVG